MILTREEVVYLKNTKKYNRVRCFKRFLMQKGVYADFMKNLMVHHNPLMETNNIRYSRKNGRSIVSILSLNDPLVYSFTWGKTKEGFNYWTILNDEWYTKVERINEY